MGHGRCPRSLYRLRSLCDGLPGGEQHSGRRRAAGGAWSRDQLDPRRALLRGRVPRCESEVPSRPVPALRRGALRAGLPDLRQPSHRRRSQRAGLQPLHRDAILRQCVPVQRPLLRLLQPGLGEAAPSSAESGRVGPRGRRDGEVHVLRAADYRRKDSGGSGDARSEGRRDPARLRAGLPGESAGLRRSERSRQRSVAPVPVAARQQASRGSRHAAQDHLPARRGARMNGRDERLASDLMRPLLRTSPIWYVWVAVLTAFVAAGLFCWWFQMWQGLGVTGLRWPVFWGFLITDFVFWIGISHAGTLISAMLRLANAGWRGGAPLPR